MNTSAATPTIIKQISTIDLQSSHNYTPDSLNTSSYGSDPLVNKFGNFQEILNLQKIETEYISTIPQPDKESSLRMVLDNFIKDIDTIKKTLGNISQQIHIRNSQELLEEARLEKLEVKAERHEKKLVDIDERCKAVDAGVKEYDKISRYFGEVFEGFEKNALKIQEVGKRQSKIEGIIAGMGGRKGRSAMCSISPRPRSKLILTPRVTKTSKN